MHDPKIVEAMARAIEPLAFNAVLRVQNKDWFPGTIPLSEEQAAAALAALCTLRPDVAAVLRGEAVAVPREATDAMASRVNGTCVTVTIDGTWAVTRQEAKRIHAALVAASPYTQETNDDR